jgi:hypothetical protein
MDDLLAFANSIQELPDIDIHDIGENHYPHESAYIPDGGGQFFPPPHLDSTFQNPIIVALASRKPFDMGGGCEKSSPGSPTAKGRVSLFSGSDKPVELDVGGDSNDPRCLYVMDHPGRNSQFKHWYANGLVTDDKRRTTFREESMRESCWQSLDTEKKDLATDGILGFLKQSAISGSIPSSPENENVVSALIGGYQNPKDVWKSRCYLVGSNLKVALSDMALTDDVFKGWCIWFNDLLCEWGLSDRMAHPSSSSQLTTVDADLDFSKNALTDSSVDELVRLLSAFRRIRVRTLRVSSNILTDIFFNHLLNLPYINQVFFEENSISPHAMCDWIQEMVSRKLELYDILVAQDTPDPAVRDPMFLHTAQNKLSDPISIIDNLESRGIRACNADVGGCSASTLCRVWGGNCAVHLSGLGAQQIRQ